MKMSSIGLFIAFLLASQTTPATEYIYRDLMANTLPSAACSLAKDAQAKATQPYNIDRFSKRFCQSQGYGWHVEAIKNNGKLVCQDCTGADSGKQRCYVEDVVVSCKRIKPGSVGMLPGQS